jgi:hypothetical protein
MGASASARLGVPSSQPRECCVTCFSPAPCAHLAIAFHACGASWSRGSELERRAQRKVFAAAELLNLAATANGPLFRSCR